MQNEARTEQVIRNARMMLELTQEEAGRLVGVTRRAWELWEAGARKMPMAAFELFIAKISGQVPSSFQQNDRRQLVVVVASDRVTPIDVVSNENFLSLVENIAKNTAAISSLGIDRFTGKPYKHETHFWMDINEHVLRTARQWQQEPGQAA